jgi:nitroimidazol reductase NimA-like FMN-containing flavoprotein (pyridoxamine 5'-phosphate oxidase superfamily)
MTFLPQMTREEMLDLLIEERVGRIGLNDRPQPYVVPTDFAYIDGAIYIHTPQEGRKALLARRNPNVCFEVDRYNENVTEFRSIIVRGRIAEVSDREEQTRVMQCLAAKAVKSGAPVVYGTMKEKLPPIAIFRIEIADMTGVRSAENGHPPLIATTTHGVSASQR